MCKKIKVGLFIDTWYPMVDGVIEVVNNYAKRLNKICDVTVFTVDGDKKDTKVVDYKVVKCKRLNLNWLDYSLPVPEIDLSFKKILDDSQLDIVHIQSPFALGKIAIKYAKSHKIPIIATLHSQYKQDFYNATKNNVLTKMLLSEIIKNINACDEYYAVNSKTAEVFKGYGTKKTPLVQKNGTDLTPILQEEKEKMLELVNNKFNIDKCDTVFLFVGRIVQPKNIFFIVKALKLLEEKFPNFKMLFVGTGVDEKRLKNLINQLNLTSKVILTGKIIDRTLLSALYLRAKLFLFPSLYDSSSLVQIEASSQGTPTLFLEGSVTSATVTNNVNGFFSENSERAYADKIYEILTDDKLYDSVSRGAVRDLFVTWDDCVKEMYEKYLSLIEKNKKRVELKNCSMQKGSKTTKKSKAIKNIKKIQGRKRNTYD